MTYLYAPVLQPFGKEWHKVKTTIVAFGLTCLVLLLIVLYVAIPLIGA